MPAQANILIIEDDADINDVVATYLKKQGFSCTQAYSGSEAKLVLDNRQPNNRFDIIITDLMLPGLSGKQLVDSIRAKSDVPIIVASAQDSATEKLNLFDLGVDDYLVKPFDLDELLARISVQLRHASRRAGEPATAGGALRQFRTWTIDPEARQFTADGTAIKLTRLEFNIVETLVGRPTKVFTKQELFELAWQEESFVEEKAINVHISNIRAKLKDAGAQDYIETVWGIGFKLAD